VGSAVRSRIAADSAFATAGFAAWRAFIPGYRAPRLPADVPASGETLGGGHRFVHVILGDLAGSVGSGRSGVYWVATAPGAPRPEPAATQLDLLRRWFSGWPEPIGDLLAATDPDDLLQDAVGELRPLPRALSSTAGVGGYALVGDAGHAMTHYLGQGACLALEDAATLRTVVQDTIPGQTLGRALEEYSRMRLPRVTKVAARSRRVGLALQGHGGLGLRARNAAMGRFLPRLLDRAAAEAVDWSPPERLTPGG
jgi:2-polyprenyl-6-methoxyphenol hydroxylase-like FAD-dependent oxidoreductase